MNCNDCKANKVCDHNKYGFENCDNFIPAEVKHGKWIDKYNNEYVNHLFICSECSKAAHYEFYPNELEQTKARQVLTEYCPNCGAKMDRSDE